MKGRLDLWPCVCGRQQLARTMCTMSIIHLKVPTASTKSTAPALSDTARCWQNFSSTVLADCSTNVFLPTHRCNTQSMYASSMACQICQNCAGCHAQHFMHDFPRLSRTATNSSNWAVMLHWLCYCSKCMLRMMPHTHINNSEQLVLQGHSRQSCHSST
jgi:hypothetical protein